ncbi:uncharacterized protein PHALS_10122 [Plasmopara halstedii]|uniref:DNA replication checkpoint mediator MRC1 domain-containing protein n=1 Tax=Plasmopara halstedii TaxID=4781 RepID=A0A0P1AGT5_PLAHL|nr:uncharacterized protein PHALS_10122 [Plasmopara halstedii]CEG39894.1 hypothetical protein PHALS_10122 [Plasmopara halstedii]|eukprot:XP_024576263.1 hypothetical protein PHALS_10122 [Plasmopara halstedii]
MSGSELALETQLLLQEATHITQRMAVECVLESASAQPVESEFESAKSALLEKLRRKKEAQRAQHQHLHQRRREVSVAKSTTSCKALNLPVAAATTTASRKKLDLLSKLRTQAIQQGAQTLATMFGYATYEEHHKALDERDREKEVAEDKEEKEEKEDQSVEIDLVETIEEDTPKEVSVVSEITDAMELHPTEEVNERAEVDQQSNRIQKQADVAEDDGNEADSEQDEKDEIDEMQDQRAMETTTCGHEANTRDKAAGYRKLLRAEAMQNMRDKRRDNFVESEAEEEDEKDVLNIGGLGDFGFGVPQAKTQESKEAEEERNALKLRKDDLDHIVDELSDDERAEERDLDEIFRREQEDEDRQQVKEVMRNVKEGFGRNRRAFSSLHATSEARGRFNLDELVAADGNKFEAARLGLLESDEEVSDLENGKKKTSKDDDEKYEEEDEEAEMERMLRERFQNQPKIYVTSSESGSDDENEDDSKTNDSNDDDFDSDGERERLQIKLFSERARINRRMQRMKDLKRQIALENEKDDPNVNSDQAMPNFLLEDDKDSQEVMLMMNRTDVNVFGHKQPSISTVGRLHSFGTLTSASQSSSSFSRVIGHCKLFSTDSTGGSTSSSKGFVFTSFSNDKSLDTRDENAAPNHETTPRVDGRISAATKRRTKPTAAGNARNKKHKSSDLYSVLSAYQCVSSTNHGS